MKKQNKKEGFTIVELVIVIAVIAILAAVLIPTFSGVVKKANQSAALQTCRNELIEVKATLAMNGTDLAEGVVFEENGFYFEYKDGELTEDSDFDATGKTATKLKNVNLYQSVPVVLEDDSNKWWASYDVEGLTGHICAGLKFTETLPCNINSVTNLKVYDSDGKLFYTENDLTEQVSLTSAYGPHFYLVAPAAATNLGDNSWHTADNRPYATAEQAEGYYYYTLTLNGTPYTGVFYFAD